MIPLMALLWLGLSMGTRSPVQAETLPRPTLWAEPGSLVPWGSSVNLWCWGTSGAQVFHLNKTGSSSLQDMQFLLESGDKAKFSISYITEAHAGTYYCNYLSHTKRSEPSDPLELVVTGLYSKPFLSALPSSVVVSGGTMTLQCGSWQGFDTFILTQEGDPKTLRNLDAQQLPSGQRQAVFSVGPVNPNYRWLFQCYGYFSGTSQLWSQPSDPLQVLVSGASRRPSLMSPQGPIVTPGQNLALQCRSKDAYDTFALYKEESLDSPQQLGRQLQAGISQANFPLGPGRVSHGGRYRCFGRQGFTPLWSEPSDPLDILVAEQLSYTPALSVEPGPSVSSGDNVTLLCQSRGWTDTFLLVKEGAVDSPLLIKVIKTEAITQAQFSFHPVTSTHGGTYRCYSSNSISPYRLSHPSARLLLRVSGPSGDIRNPPTVSRADVATGDYTVENFIRLVTAGFILLVLGILLLEAWHSQRRC